jgi:release factor glutamine methyltransferase
MLIAFGSSGDLDYLRRLLDEEGFAVRVVAEQSLVRDDWQVDYFTFLVTPAAEQ